MTATSKPQTRVSRMLSMIFVYICPLFFQVSNGSKNMGPPRPLCLLVYNPIIPTNQPYIIPIILLSIAISTINPSEIVVTNQLSHLGGPTLYQLVGAPKLNTLIALANGRHLSTCSWCLISSISVLVGLKRGGQSLWIYHWKLFSTALFSSENIAKQRSRIPKNLGRN